MKEINKLTELDTPLNIDERYLHAINIRLEILIKQFSSFLEVYASNNSIATTANVHVEETPIVKEEIKEEVVEVKSKKKTTKK